MRFCDLGSLVIDLDGVEFSPGGRKPSAVLALLLMDVNRRVSVDALMAAVWGDTVTAGAASTLESHVWRLRRVLEPGRGRGEPPSVLVTDSGGYRLIANGDQVDSKLFEQLHFEVADLVASAQFERAVRRADEALRLWRGRPYEPVSGQIWAAVAVARLEEMRMQMLERRVDALLGNYESERALTDVGPLLAEQPFREHLWAQQMLALYQCGRTEEALQGFQRARGVLRDEVGLDPGIELRELEHRILLEDPLLLRPNPQVTAPRRPVEVHLPRRLPMIGRVGDLDDLCQLLAAHRLVTITGSAGCGKTRLAIEVARTVADRYVDGVWFVDLSAVSDPAAVIEAVVVSLGIGAPATGSGHDALRAFASGRRMLVVVDNCEQVLAGVVGVCESLFTDGSEVAVVATSREPLDWPGEKVRRLGPLPLTESGYSTVSPAVALFLDRVASANRDVYSEAPELAVAESICTAVDGVPLAIELAAGLAEVYSLVEIARLVSADPGRLTSVGRASPDHHRTVHIAIERSHALLSAPERVVHRRLAALPGAFTLSVATATAGHDPVAAAEVGGLVARLVHRSMVTATRATRADGPTVFSQLATVRGHASMALVEAGEAEAVLDRRDGWSLDLVRRHPRIGRAEERQWFDAVEADEATLRATMQRRIAERPGPAGAEIARGLVLYWYYRGGLIEGRRWLQLAVDRAVGSDPVDDALTRLSLASLLSLHGRADLARPHLDAGLPAVGSAPSERLLEVGDRLVGLAAAVWTADDVVSLRQVIAQTDVVVDVTGDADLAVIAQALGCLADTATQRLDITAARAAEIYQRAETVGNLFAGWLACGTCTTVALMARDPQQGLAWSARAIDYHHRLGGREGPVFLESRANFLCMSGEHGQAVRMYAASHGQARRAGMMWPRRSMSTDLLEQARGVLSRAEFEQAWLEGTGLTLADVVASNA